MPEGYDRVSTTETILKKCPCIRKLENEYTFKISD